MKFLMGLNDSFSQVKTQILLMDPLLSINKVYSLLIQEEMQQVVSNGSISHVKSTTLVAKGQSFGSNSGSIFNGNNAGKARERPTCTHCGKLGHTIEKCYKLHGFPPGFKFKGKGSMAHQVSSN